MVGLCMCWSAWDKIKYCWFTDIIILWCVRFVRALVLEVLCRCIISILGGSKSYMISFEKGLLKYNYCVRIWYAQEDYIHEYLEVLHVKGKCYVQFVSVHIYMYIYMLGLELPDPMKKLIHVPFVSLKFELNSWHGISGWRKEGNFIYTVFHLQ